MKQEVRDIFWQVLYSSPTSAVALVSKFTVAEWIAIVLGIFQALYLIRKWWREETEFGLKLKHWVRDHTRPSDLSGK